MAIRASLGITAVLSTTPQSIYSLLAAVDPNAPRTVRLLRIMGHEGNTDSILFGDANVAATRYGAVVELHTDPPIEQSSENTNSISLTNKYIRGLAATPTVHIFVDCF